MFIWDFVAESVMGQVLDWIYSQLVGFLGDFFAQMERSCLRWNGYRESSCFLPILHGPFI